MTCDQLTVEETLRKWPQALTVFIERKTKCPGCYMQRFCTLKDVAETYQISLDDLMRELEECAQSGKNNQRNTL
jgi:hybrid cluster-associated redox disulfide protein